MNMCWNGQGTTVSMLVILKESMGKKTFLIYNQNSEEIKEFTSMSFPPPNKTNQLIISQHKLELIVWVV
jgi:hypothetical protein